MSNEYDSALQKIADLAAENRDLKDEFDSAMARRDKIDSDLDRRLSRVEDALEDLLARVNGAG